jgi:uncharacterized Tic20 family protein
MLSGAWVEANLDYLVFVLLFGVLVGGLEVWLRRRTTRARFSRVFGALMLIG